MKALPISADHLPEEISPEGAEIANTYLELNCDITKTSETLEIPGHEINRILSTKPVQNYIIQVLTDIGMRSMDKITESMEGLIDAKMAEMNELDMTSSKDVADLLQMMHKMQVEKSKLLTAKIPKDTLPNQRNQQVNIFNADDNSQYAKLMRAIVGST